MFLVSRYLLSVSRLWLSRLKAFFSQPAITLKSQTRNNTTKNKKRETMSSFQIIIHHLQYFFRNFDLAVGYALQCFVQSSVGNFHAMLFQLFAFRR